MAIPPPTPPAWPRSDQHYAFGLSDAELDEYAPGRGRDARPRRERVERALRGGPRPSAPERAWSEPADEPATAAGT